MRRPSKLEVLYEWHTQACAGRAWHYRLNESEPRCGYFKTRLVPRGPFVPARIWMEQITDDETGELTQPEVLRCEIDGVPKEPLEEWVRLCNQAISHNEFDYMTRCRHWAKANDHDEYQAAWRPVDHLSTPILEE